MALTTFSRIPHGFYEHQMREYFSQFGTISKLRLARNRRTGASKHFAFIEFESDEVAKIVANTMDNYLMFGHILKCKYAPQESLHPDLWKGANKRFKRVPYTMLEKKALEAPKTAKQWEKKNAKEQKKREQRLSLVNARVFWICKTRSAIAPAVAAPQGVSSLTWTAGESRAVFFWK